MGGVRLDRLLDRQAEVVGRTWRKEVPKDASFVDGARDRLRIETAAQHYPDGLRMVAPNERQERRAAHPGHVLVTHDHGHWFTGQDAKSLHRALGRDDAEVPVAQNLRHTGDMLRRLMPENIKLEYSLPGGLWLVRMDTSQVDQILLNLALNARDAMPDGESVTIDAANVTVCPSVPSGARRRRAGLPVRAGHRTRHRRRGVGARV